jgi:hypothetical protein
MAESPPKYELLTKFMLRMRTRSVHVRFYGPKKIQTDYLKKAIDSRFSLSRWGLDDATLDNRWAK